MFEEDINWYVVDKKYISYLQKYDKNVQNINYGEKLKPYIGIIFQVNNFDYYVPISSVKDKHYKISSPEMYKVQEKGKIFSVLNLNNMVPIMPEEVKLLKYSEISKYITFDSIYEEKKYIALLSKELNLINKNKEKLIAQAKRVYLGKEKFPDSKISKRSCDFKLLEKKCLEYEIMKSKENDEELFDDIDEYDEKEEDYGMEM